VLAGLLAWLGFGWVWTHSEQLPMSLQRIVIAPFAPGYGLAVLADQLGMDDRNYMKSSALILVGNTVFWAVVFYGLATVYVRRKERPRVGP